MGFISVDFNSLKISVTGIYKTIQVFTDNDVEHTFRCGGINMKCPECGKYMKILHGLNKLYNFKGEFYAFLRGIILWTICTVK